MNVPNLISLARLLLVPLIIHLIMNAYYDWAFALFVLAGLSDAVDGYIAKALEQSSTIGVLLDPLADKALIVSVYVALGYQNMIDDLVVILVVFRDVLIVGGVMLLFFLRGNTRVRPAAISKLNTGTQIFLATIVLAEAGLGVTVGSLPEVFSYCVIATTVLSGGWYVVAWARQLASVEGTQ